MLARNKFFSLGRRLIVIFFISTPSNVAHDAFSSLVDIAVQQPLLPVPHKDDKRPNVPVNDHPPPTHHEVHYHRAAVAAHEQMMAMQIRQQAEMQRRHQQQASNAYQMERERQQFQVCVTPNEHFAN